MPSMFSRRRATSQPIRPSGPPSESAAIAASSAFLHNSTSAASLSSAAAAAALRSHTTSPEPIGNLQTKRMIRRGSQSSVASGSVMGRPGAGSRAMMRRDSNSSMTDRTFRSPSPGRSSAVPPAVDAPPVPAVPKGARRSSSLQPTMRMTSPTPTRGGRYGSMDRSNFASPNRGSAALAAAFDPRPSSLDLDPESSQRSVNFSRPISPGPGPGPDRSTPVRPQSAVGYFSSPTSGPSSPRTAATNRPASALSAISATEARRIEMEIRDAANKPVMKKKKKKVIAANEGEKLANGTMHPALTGTAVNDPSSPVPASPQAVPHSGNGDVTPVKKKKKRIVTSVDTETVAQPPPKNPARYASPSGDRPRSPSSPRSAGLLHKQPSVVHEDPEAEDLAEKSLRPTGNKPRRVISISETPVRPRAATAGERPASLDIPRNSSSRNHSVSPQRHRAHFSDVIVDTTTSKHQPPPRSVSPFKSAMKRSPSSSVRGNSPASPNGTRTLGSDASDTTSLTSQDGIKPGKKKKLGARVSFDDGGTTISPPPVTTAPNISKPIRRELSPDSDMEETMTPRPALPSFGSVRGRKSQSPELAEIRTEPLSSTSDHALGALVANDFSRKSDINQKAAIPPHVTSVEGSGYSSDSSTDSRGLITDREKSDAAIPLASQSGSAAPISVANEKPSMLRSKNEVAASVLSAPIISASGAIIPSDTNATDSNIPNISVQPATPGTEDDKPILDAPGAAARAKEISMPGGWEESEESKSESIVPRRVEPIATEEPDFESSDDEEEEEEGYDDALGIPVTGAERHSPNLEPIYESDSDDSDAFIDANESFDGGFASLDAMVGVPVPANLPNRVITTPPHSPSYKPLTQTNIVSSQPPPVKSDHDWTHATAYWSSLTKERKDQMERQAQPEDKEEELDDVEEDEEEDEEHPTSSIQPQPILKKRSQAPTKISTSATEPIARSVASERQKSPTEQTESRSPILKKSMRSSTPTAVPAQINTGGDTSMRKSMRPGSAGGMKTSMRHDAAPGSPATTEPRGSLQKKRISTIASAPLPSSTGAAAAAVRSASTAAPVKAPVLPTDDSDSESSFKKKKRRGSVSTTDSAGRYNMKRSMRTSSVDRSAGARSGSPTPAPRGSGRLSIRSLSPTGSYMGRNRESIRTSLRGGPVDDTPTMRGKNSKAQNGKAMRDSKSPTRFSMSGFSKPSLPIAARASSGGNGRASGLFKSRFNDSDDSDDGAVSSRVGFRSRFADSDEEDSPIGPTRQTSAPAPANLAPVRGIPRQQNRRDDDSTDLDDSDDEVPRNNKTKRGAAKSSKPAVPSQADIDAAMAAAVKNVTAMNGGRAPGVMPNSANGEAKKQVNANLEPQSNGNNEILPPQTPTKRKGIFGGMLGRRRNSSSATVPQIPSTYYTPSAVAANSPRSPAISTTQSMNGKLQRRTTNRTNSAVFGASTEPESHEATAVNNGQNWPLSPPGKINADGVRPATSDGAEGAHLRSSMRGGPQGERSRPEFTRRSMSGGDLERMNKNTVYSEKTGKKKRFGMLRRAFGLND